MIKALLIGLLALTGIYLVLQHPGELVALLQMLLDAAYHLAHQLAGLNLHAAK